MTPARNERGAILLLVLLVVSILFVIIGQFATSMALDRALARNHLADTQARCDMRSAAALLKAAVREGGAESPLSFSLPSGRVTVTWTPEAGKFNINNLRTENVTRATDQLDRLFTLLEGKNLIQVLGLSGQIADFVLSSERPILSMGELKQIDGITDEVLQGLEKVLTVYSDGLVNHTIAPPEVLACLADGINNQKTIEEVKKKLEDPGARVPGNVAGIANRIRRDISGDSEAYRAEIRLTGGFTSRTLEVALRKEEDRYHIILFNELEANHERSVE